MISAQTAL